MKSIVILLFMLPVISRTYAQHVDLYKLTMQSDVILFVEDKNETETVEYPNDYTAQHYLTINKIDSLIKDRHHAGQAGKKIRMLTEGEDYYNEYRINCGENYMGCGFFLEQGKKFYQIHFIQKQEAGYAVIASLWYDFDWDNVIACIQSVIEIENEVDPVQRFFKSTNWYERNNLRPNPGFITYHRQRGLTGDELEQLLQADAIRITIDDNVSAHSIFLNIRDTTWLRNSGDLYYDDDTRLVYEWRTLQPFTGYVKLYRDSTWLEAKLKLVDGQISGWQTSYRQNGKLSEKYLFKYPLPQTLSGTKYPTDIEYHARQVYDNYEQLKESYTLQNSTDSLYQCTRYYSSGQKKAEGYTKYIRQEQRQFYATSMPVKKKRKHRDDYYILVVEAFYETGHWVYYHEDGSILSEGNFEIYKNEFGENQSRKTGEWKNYNVTQQ